MQKIFTSGQIREWDKFTIEHEPIPSINLMERACDAFFHWFLEQFQHAGSVLIVCGVGNNGGDGLGIARLLSYCPLKVTVCLWQEGSPTSDYTTNLNCLPKNVNQIVFEAGAELPPCDIIIDALLGSGLSRPVTGGLESLIGLINASPAIKISVDIPSGLFADVCSSGYPTVQATHTVTFQSPKLAFLLPENCKAVGEWHVLNIQLSKPFEEKTETPFQYLTTDDALKLLRRRNKFDHKGTFGHTLVVAGSRGKMGANILCTRAALRCGSGLVTSLAPTHGEQILQVAAPEAMVLPGGAGDFLTAIPPLTTFTALAVGPGLGCTSQSKAFLSELLRQPLPPVVLDADALNIISEERSLLHLIPEGSILTPHPGEFRRLAGDWKNDFERLEWQRALSKKLKSIIVLKGAHTSIAMPDGQVVFNSTGNPAMATGGSGDVLTGMIGAFLAQGYTPKAAALLGVFLHGKAGDLAAKKAPNIIASDIIASIPGAMACIQPKF